MGEFDDWEELGPPELRPVPASHQSARTAAAIAGVVLGGALLVGLGVWMLTRGGAPEVGRTPAPVTTASVEVTESFVVTASATATSTTVTGTLAPTSTPPPKPRQFGRAAKVAYRQDGALWVAEESGASPKKILASGSGAFALSPDGVTLAVVDGTAKVLLVVDVASSKVATVGPAAVRAPVWAPSSAWLAFTNGAEVRRAERDGSKMRVLGKGTHVAVGPDSAAYAFSAEGALTYVGKDGRQTRIGVTARVDDLAVGTDRIFYALGGASRASMSLRSVRLDGSDDKQLAGPPADTEAGRYDELMLSPDGGWLAYALAGDDLHSRLRAMRTDGSNDTKLSLRHDDYLLRWSADASRVLFIDGNVLQGDSTQLMSVRPDGTQRTTILKGAGT